MLQSMNVAIPQLGDAVAPRFEVATSFLLVEVAGNDWQRISTVKCSESGGYRRVRLLLFHGVDLLVCSGIIAQHRDTLVAAGINVIADVNSTVDEALDNLVSGSLKAAEAPSAATRLTCALSHEQLVTWTREIFAAAGYEVLPCPGEDCFLVDVVAEIECPVCRRRVSVAVCCCAHTYSSQQEIREFHNATATGFDARVYVCPAEDQIVDRCREYGIEVIDPKYDRQELIRREPARLPVLKSVVVGHERASGIAAGA